MSDQAIKGAGGVQKLSPAEHEETVSDLKNGELSISQGEDGNDVTVDFRGDGETSAAKITARFLELNPLKDSVLADFEGSEAAAKFGAEFALRSAKNLHLREKGLTADTPIPAGELFSAKQSDLKKALAPFKGRLPELRAALSNLESSGEMSKGQSKTIGNVRSQGRGLPVDPKI